MAGFPAEHSLWPVSRPSIRCGGSPDRANSCRPQVSRNRTAKVKGESQTVDGLFPEQLRRTTGSWDDCDGCRKFVTC